MSENNVMLREDFSGAALDASLWTVADRAFGRGTLRPANAAVGNGVLALKTPAGTYDGAEIQSVSAIHSHGSYAVRMRTCPAEGSLTTLFLYRAPDGYSELDIEVFGGPERRVDFTSYAGPTSGATLDNTIHQVRTVRGLPFDPAAGFHDYLIEYHPEYLSFYIDGKMYHRIEKPLPPGLMYLFVNLWWPTWVPAPNGPPIADVRAEYEWLEKRAYDAGGTSTRPHAPTHAPGGHDELDPKEIGAQRAGARDNSLDRGYTLTLDDAHTQHFSAPSLAANRNVVLARPPTHLRNAYRGQRFHLVRWAGNSGGPWSLSIRDNAASGPVLRALAQEQWATVEWNGVAWGLVAAGGLYG